MAKSVAVTGPQDEGYRVPAVERAFAIIRVVAAQGPLSLADVVEQSGLNKSTTFYILRTLVTLDVVSYEESTRTYSLGPALMELGLTAAGQFSDVAVAKRNLAELLERLDVTIVLYRRVGVGEIMMIDKLERAHRVRITVQAGEHLPIQGGSFGRAFLAFDEPAVVSEALKDGLHRFTPKSVTKVGAFRKELAVVRERGWAVDHEGFALGVSTVAAPIFAADGRIALVAAAVGFTTLFDDEVTERCGRELRRVCDRIGAMLGSDRPPFAATGDVANQAVAARR
jgi:DNA-binding IclR family transcriptional regulator